MSDAAAKSNKPLLLVESIMTSTVKCVVPSMTIREAILLLTTNKISGAPIVDHYQTVLSVVSEGSLLRLAASNGLDAKVADCMQKLPHVSKLITAKRNETFTDIYRVFLTNSVHRVIVVDDVGKLQGIVSRSNLLRLLIEKAETPAPPPKKVDTSAPDAFSEVLKANAEIREAPAPLEARKK